MRRVMMQVYVKDSHLAAEMYQNAFDKPIKNVVLNDDGTYIHGEMDLGTCVLSFSEAGDAPTTGNTMQFCIHYGEGNEAAVQRAYAILSEGATLIQPLEPCFYSPLMTDLIDQFGVRWCLFV